MHKHFWIWGLDLSSMEMRHQPHLQLCLEMDGGEIIYRFSQSHVPIPTPFRLCLKFQHRVGKGKELGGKLEIILIV